MITQEMKKPLENMITIVIPAKDEQDNLPHILYDLRSQKLPKNKTLEIIVALSPQSTDKSENIARKYDAKIIKGGLPSTARNNGAKEATGEYIYFIDSDIRLRNNNFIQNSYYEISSKKWDFAAMDNIPEFELHDKNFEGHKINFWQKQRLNFYYDLMNFFVRTAAKTKKPKANGTCIIARKEAFLSIKGFNKRIYYGEDSELVERARKNNYSFGILNKNTYITASVRKPLVHGIETYFWNGIVLDWYRSNIGEVYSKKLYQQLTNITEHFSLEEKKELNLTLKDFYLNLTNIRKMNATIKKLYFRAKKRNSNYLN